MVNLVILAKLGKSNLFKLNLAKLNQIWWYLAILG
jgi:hypothetical protein